jgi:hypothetical protein
MILSNELKELLVSKVTAKLAKEKGFDMLTIYFFLEEGVYKAKKGFSLNKLQYVDWNHNENTIGFISAPTHALLQQWLREVKNIDVFAYSVRFTGYIEIGYYTYSIISETPVRNYRFDTYEEALDMGLQEALKMI